MCCEREGTGRRRDHYWQSHGEDHEAWSKFHPSPRLRRHGGQHQVRPVSRGGAAEEEGGGPHRDSPRDWCHQQQDSGLYWNYLFYFIEEHHVDVTDFVIDSSSCWIWFICMILLDLWNVLRRVNFEIFIYSTANCQKELHILFFSITPTNLSQFSKPGWS